MTDPLDGQSVRPAMERAEELVDRVGQRAGPLASLVGQRILRAAALARETVEDIWAEAQSAREESHRSRESRPCPPRQNSMPQEPDADR